MAAAPLPHPRRLLAAAALLGGLGVAGWTAFAWGAAGLVLRSGPCAGTAPMGALVALWLAAVVAVAVAPPWLLLRRGRWRPALRALAVGALAAGAGYGLAFFGVAAGCG